jgi:hypothetical protein
MQHLQYHCSEIGAYYFWVGKGGSALKVFFGIESITDAIGNPTTASRALIGTGL